MADDLAGLRREVGALRDELGVLSANVPLVVDSVLAPEVNDFREALATTRAELQQEHNGSMAELLAELQRTSREELQAWVLALRDEVRENLGALRAEVGALRDEMGWLYANVRSGMYVPQLVHDVLASEFNDFREALVTTRAELQQEHNRSMAELRSDMGAICEDLLNRAYVRGVTGSAAPPEQLQQEPEPEVPQQQPQAPRVHTEPKTSTWMPATSQSLDTQHHSHWTRVHMILHLRKPHLPLQWWLVQWSGARSHARSQFACSCCWRSALIVCSSQSNHLVTSGMRCRMHPLRPSRLHPGQFSAPVGHPSRLTRSCSSSDAQCHLFLALMSQQSVTQRENSVTVRMAPDHCTNHHWRGR
jgi:hypothetical protein